MLKEWFYIAGLLMTIFLKNRYYISHVVNFGASLKLDDVMLVEMWCVYSTSRPSPLNSLGVSQTTTLFMISTGQVINKKSAMDGLHYWPARWEA